MHPDTPSWGLSALGEGRPREGPPPFPPPRGERTRGAWRARPRRGPDPDGRLATRRSHVADKRRQACLSDPRPLSCNPGMWQYLCRVAAEGTNDLRELKG